MTRLSRRFAAEWKGRAPAERLANVFERERDDD
jgi:hypothetical protein